MQESEERGGEEVHEPENGGDQAGLVLTLGRLHTKGGEG